MFIVDIYGPSVLPAQSSQNGLYDGGGTKKTRSVLHISLSDNVPAHGPIHDITFSLAKNGVSYSNFCLSPKVRLTQRRTGQFLSLLLQPGPDRLAGSLYFKYVSWSSIT